MVDNFLCIVKIQWHSLSSLKEIEKARKENLNHNPDFWKLKGIIIWKAWEPKRKIDFASLCTWHNPFLIFHLQNTEKTLAPAMKQNHSIKECSPSLPPFQTRIKDYDLIFVWMRNRNGSVLSGPSLHQRSPFQLNSS